MLKTFSQFQANVSRFSQDIQLVDGELPFNLMSSGLSESPLTITIFFSISADAKIKMFRRIHFNWTSRRRSNSVKIYCYLFSLPNHASLPLTEILSAHLEEITPLGS